MRDAFLLAVLPFLIYGIFQRPFIGLGLWIWTAMFFPNAWVYGIATSIRYNLLFSGLTIAAYLLSKQKAHLKLGSIGSLAMLFFAWTTLTTIVGMAPPEITWEFWSRLAKIMALFVFILLAVDKKLHIDFFLWCLILSIGFLAGLEGLKYIASGGGHHIAGMAGHVIGDRNDLALAMAMLLPICFYLLGEYGKKSWALKVGLLGLVALIVISIIGTNSRGGLIALLAVGGYLFLKSKRKILFSLLAVGAVGVLAGLIPDEWYQRMDTIGDAGADASFMGRVVAWKMSFILAMQHPLFGGGFRSLEYFPVWTDLARDFSSYSFFHTGTAIPDTTRAHAAHSIYFQVLGDHGFVGLIIFLLVLVLAFIKAGVVAKIARKSDYPDWVSNLATMLRLAIFTFAVGGAALSLAYFDLIYAICAMVQVLELKILPELAKRVRDSGRG